ncbi:MAG: hypothetical protein Q8Q04_03765 [archaeon]|nr:hypothetical protein [archaeon]
MKLRYLLPFILFGIGAGFGQIQNEDGNGMKNKSFSREENKLYFLAEDTCLIKEDPYLEVFYDFNQNQKVDVICYFPIVPTRRDSTMNEVKDKARFYLGDCDEDGYSDFYKIDMNGNGTLDKDGKLERKVE